MSLANWKPHQELLVVLVTPPKRINYRSASRLMLYQMTGDCGLDEVKQRKRWHRAAHSVSLPTGSYAFNGDWARWFGTCAMPTPLYRAENRWRNPLPFALVTPDRRWFAQNRATLRTIHDAVSMVTRPTPAEWADMVVEQLDKFPYTLTLFVDAVI